MAKANTYKLKEGITVEDLDKLGFYKNYWLNEDKNRECMGKSIMLIGGVELDMYIKINPIEFDDFDNILVLDSSFCQPYTPFYGDNYKRDITNFDFLEKVIDRYNQAMNLQGIFEVVD